ncbi:MAG: hypothetical protein M3Q88_06550 [Pseudomonadota bacterium]|nr:hypothetical protein [Pseudomonadota bacterium]
MRLMLASTIAVLGALTSVATSAPANAQSRIGVPRTVKPKSATQAVSVPTTVAGAAAPICQAGITTGARTALIALQQSVTAKDSVNIPPRLAAAQAVVKSNDDRCFIAQLRVKAAFDADNLSAVSPALEAQLATGSVPTSRIATMFDELGTLQFRKADYANASASFERALALEPQRVGTVIILAETRVKQNRIADALPLYRKALAMEVAAGRVPDQKWFRRAVAVSHEAKSPLVYGFARDWISAYPSADNWRDAIRVYANVSGADDASLIDMYRLQRLTRSLKGEGDHARYAQILISRGFPGEAKAMLEEGFAANAVDRSLASVKNYHAVATTKAAGDRASLDAQATAALASPAAKQAMVLGEAYFGYGDYAKAAALFRAAQGKSGVDAELAYLRLGMALAASGDRAGATAALGQVSGPRADIARYWQTYANTRS